MREFHESAFVVRSGALWDRARQATFLTAVADGTLPEDAFRQWLVQDYHFAKGLTSFQAITAAKTPRPPQKLVIDGLAVMSDEIDWFESIAANRRIDLNVSANPVCRRYVDFLLAAAYAESFEVLLAILYGVEVSYLAAWSALAPSGPFAEFIHRWSNEQFRVYVQGLLTHCEEHRHPNQQELFNSVLHPEAAFWRMTWER